MTLSAVELVASFTVKGEPVSKARARFTKRGSKVATYTPQKTLDGERAVAWAFKAATRGYQPDAESTFRVEGEFYNGTRQRRDVDNMMKLVLDGLNGIAWGDDNQVTQIAAVKSWVDNRDEARTVVRVYRVGKLEPPTAECIRCGTPFRTYASWASNPNGKKYCSSDCCYKHRIERRERVCAHCGAGFLANQAGAKYCSKECAYGSRRVTLKCDGCGTDFQRANNLVRKTNYCTPECAASTANARRRSRLPGTCASCGAGTTRKEYTRCASCKRSQERIYGRKGAS